LDVTATDSVGRTACNMSRRYMSSVTVDLGFVIEGRQEDEVSSKLRVTASINVIKNDSCTSIMTLILVTFIIAATVA
jgi:hypothetical protein